MQTQKSLLAAALFSLFLAACGGQKTETPAPAPMPASEVSASDANAINPPDATIEEPTTTETASEPMATEAEASAAAASN